VNPVGLEKMLAVRIHETGLLTPYYAGLRLEEVPRPQPQPGEVLIRTTCCGVCHTEIDEIEGRAPPSRMPMIPGHQVVGVVVAEGAGCRLDLLGQRVGVAWIFSACGACSFCRAGLENLCPDFLASGLDRPGGYAEYMAAEEAFVHAIPHGLPSEHAAPLLCAGAVGYRALQLCELRNGDSLGLTGFGSSGQLVLQMARHLFPDSRVYVFARSPRERAIALQSGAHWAGDTTDRPAGEMRAIIDTTPAWLPVLAALERLAPGGRLIINAIRKESADRNLLADIDYSKHLWREKTIKSVANVTREDVRSLLSLAVDIPLVPNIVAYGLNQALKALLAIKSGHIEGTGVLRIAAH
jgi:propanol-preferring alcohol dehydrogenase